MMDHEKKKASQARYRKKNAEKIRAYLAATRERRAKVRKDWIARNAEKHRAYYAAYRKAKAETLRAQGRIRRAKKRSANPLPPVLHTTYIYHLIDTDGSVFYVGKSKNPYARLLNHLGNRLMSLYPSATHIREMRADGHHPEVLIVKACESDGTVEERGEINRMAAAGSPLLNISDDHWNELNNAERLQASKTAAAELARSRNPKDLPGEIWKPVVGWEDLYDVSDQGRVRRKYNRYGVIVFSLTRCERGEYPMVGLSRKGRSTTRSIHGLVASAFIGPRPDGYVINHIDGNKMNARVANLE
jgi:hypothetical protein